MEDDETKVIEEYEVIRAWSVEEALLRIGTVRGLILITIAEQPGSHGKVSVGLPPSEVHHVISALKMAVTSTLKPAVISALEER